MQVITEDGEEGESSEQDSDNDQEPIQSLPAPAEAIPPRSSKPTAAKRGKRGSVAELQAMAGGNTARMDAGGLAVQIPALDLVSNDQHHDSQTVIARWTARSQHGSSRCD